MVWATYGAPGSVLLTLFLQEWLHAEKWQIGLVITMTYLGPTFEPLGAYLVERFGGKRKLFIGTFLFNRAAFFALALVPWLGSAESCNLLGIAAVLAIVGGTRVVAHTGTPAWWSWMADLVPERCRGRFFGCRTQWASCGTAASYLIGMTLLQTCGGMANRVLVSTLFAVGAAFGVADILFYLAVPEPAAPKSAERGSRRTEARNQTKGPHSALDALTLFAEPYRQPAFRRLLVCMGLWSFSANMVLPFLPVYQRGEMLAGQPVGLGVSWLFLAVLNVASSLAAMCTSNWWGRWSDRFGPRGLLMLASGYLFVNLVYLGVRPDGSWGLLVPVALVSGALNAAWTVGSYQLLLQVAPRQNRSVFVSVHNLTNGWLMAGGPLLGGLLADRLPLVGWCLPNGLPCCYFHLLLALAAVGGVAALVVLVGMPSPAAAAPAAAPDVRYVRVRLLAGLPRLRRPVTVDNSQEIPIVS
jgi:hypothetical protein